MLAPIGGVEVVEGDGESCRGAGGNGTEFSAGGGIRRVGRLGSMGRRLGWGDGIWGEGVSALGFCGVDG